MSTEVWRAAVAPDGRPDPVRVVLISCGKKKLPTPGAAREVYCAAYFQECLRYAESVGDEVRIVSAKYGLLSPETPIEPYELRIEQLSPTQRCAWARDVMGKLGDELLGIRFVAVLLCGESYAAPIRLRCQQQGIGYSQPLAGLEIGERRQRMADALRPKSGEAA